METFVTYAITLVVFAAGPVLALAHHPLVWIPTITFVIAFVASWFLSPPWRWILAALVVILWIGYGGFCVGRYHLVEWPGINPAGGPGNTQATPANPIVTGSNTSSNARNRVESVGIPATPGVVGGVVVSPKAEPGTYLVICNVREHFNDGMFAFVEVKKDD
jgi:hypothetical protein